MYNHKDGITLRKVGRKDLDCLLALKLESWWGTHGTLIINDEDQEKWYNNIGSDIFLAAEADSLVGVACYTDIDWIGRSLHISGSILKECRDYDRLVKPAFAAGLDFAFEILNMHRLNAEVLESNIVAQRLEIDYLGFQVEGRKRQAVYKAGRYYDSLILGILRDEWIRSPRVLTYGSSCNKNFDHDKIAKLMKRYGRKA